RLVDGGGDRDGAALDGLRAGRGGRRQRLLGSGRQAPLGGQPLFGLHEDRLAGSPRGGAMWMRALLRDRRVGGHRGQGRRQIVRAATQGDLGLGVLLLVGLAVAGDLVVLVAVLLLVVVAGGHRGGGDARLLGGLAGLGGARLLFLVLEQRVERG